MSERVDISSETTVIRKRNVKRVATSLFLVILTTLREHRPIFYELER